MSDPLTVKLSKTEEEFTRTVMRVVTEGWTVGQLHYLARLCLTLAAEMQREQAMESLDD